MELPLLPEDLGVLLDELPLQRPDLRLVARVLRRLLLHLRLQVRDERLEDLGVVAVGDRRRRRRHGGGGFTRGSATGDSK